MLVCVRPSNEALLRARVPGAQEINRPPSPSLPSSLAYLFRSGLVDPLVRASNEHIPIK